MRTEIPECHRCCFFLPLRYGLILWGFFKLVTSCFTLTFFTFAMCELVRVLKDPEESFKAPIFNVVAVCIAGAVAVTDLILTSIYIVGCFQKNVKLLRMYYFYSTALLVLQVVFSIYSFVISAYYTYLYNDHNEAMILPIVMYEVMEAMVLVANLALQAYILLLVRSEIRKLENRSQLRFVNYAAEAQCTLETNSDIKEEPEKKTQELENNDKIIYV